MIVVNENKFNFQEKVMEVSVSSEVLEAGVDFIVLQKVFRLPRDRASDVEKA